MPASIVQGILEIVFQVFLEFVCYFLGRLVVPLISFGHWQCDPLGAGSERRKFWSLKLYRRQGNRLYLPPEATQLVGLLTILFFIGTGIFMWHLTKS